MASSMKVDLLYVDRCPHRDATADRVRKVAERLGLEVELTLVRVRSAEEAQRLRFLGSPTVRVNGVDIDPAASDQSDFGLCCRVYNGAGVPSEVLIASALKRHV